VRPLINRSALFFIITLTLTGCAYNPPLEFVESSELLAVDIEAYVAATLPIDTFDNKETRALGIWIIAKARQHADYLTMTVDQSPLVDSILELIKKGEINVDSNSDK